MSMSDQAPSTSPSPCLEKPFPENPQVVLILLEHSPPRTSWARHLQYTLHFPSLQPSISTLLLAFPASGPKFGLVTSPQPLFLLYKPRGCLQTESGGCRVADSVMSPMPGPLLVDPPSLLLAHLSSRSASQGHHKRFLTCKGCR